ncbi:MAG: UDP-N-acetylglucosamine 2-epimerase (non-hydrolyzing) [Proteobacteria bacterium]|nr:UDP-N-acetylglucosamine 2-epimerase (non-hydrolyzing) [Pseudomonadota bacterium]
MRLVTVLGARPQFIKASVVSSELAKCAGVQEVVIHTGQHFDANMSDLFFAELGMSKPAHELGIHGGPHGEMTGRMLIGIERILADERPDIVLIYGDTNSTLAGALAAVKLHIPVAHVEAGLRSFNMRMPEEVNRIVTDRVSTWLFAPTGEAVTHLGREGVDPARIHQVGDVMYDVALHHGARAAGRANGAVRRLGLVEKGFALATVHRAENTDDPDRLEVIVDALAEVGRGLPLVWPLHPRTRAVLERVGLLSRLEQSVRLIEPQGYLDMLELEHSAVVIATDSGGVQKEAFFHRVPCVTLRDETEWMELVVGGWNTLAAPVSAKAVIEAIETAIGRQGSDITPYGNGDAAKRIAHHLSGVGIIT